MASVTSCAPLEPASISLALEKISDYIYRTPLLKSRCLDDIASCSEPRRKPFSTSMPIPPIDNTANHKSTSHVPKFNLYFKCENFQRTGAFKARGAFYAISSLVDELGLEVLRRKSVVTASSGNHAQGLALAASTFEVPVLIVMPRNSNQSKIQGVAASKSAKGEILFCGSSNEEKKAAVEVAVASSGGIFVPPYEHPDIILGQGTCAKELDEQFRELTSPGASDRILDAVLAPLGGGGLLGGIATWFSDKPQTKVFGAEPSFGGADDAVRGLEKGERIAQVSSSTIADGLRTPVGVLNWGIVSDPNKVEGVFAADEEEIKMAMELIFEKLKIVVEPSACVPFAVLLFNERFRDLVAQRQVETRVGVWNVAIVLSGGNTTIAAVRDVFNP
ncbi:pyridoxal-phosphate dependent enzyme-domain-containing protein [Ilyonectria robusta]|uniref:pyridoxal-phosphate dependent enzyme-domain-containing protein n=1 Tax=Ilyonectria robusta TaxID=1079257 RepID=UPI001E8E9D18|nr:pyridoxal-phosphate dependent enzyme-domain-containing protein [Ilyonectria robusta]KAH8667763.1 pyridoxal-phosphate dependent enzyme-domain-containing protein [Ilyonectria robusta]